MSNLAVNEIFYTFQGEGDHMGRAALFVRLHGCAVRCQWCDSAGTWHPDYVPDDVRKMTAQEILAKAKEVGAPIVVFTGGEPCHQDMREVTALLGEHDIERHLETSGAFPIKGVFDYIMVSPKRAKEPLPECIEAASAMKVIVERPQDISYWLFDNPVTRTAVFRRIPIWLHPEWSKRGNREVLDAIIVAVKEHSTIYLHAGWQIHKNYMADALDPRSRPLVPLGGNPELGY